MERRLKLLLPVAIVITGVLGAVALVATRPDVETNSPEPVAPLVRVIDVTPQTVQLRVTTHGTVAPSTESDLVPEVSGPIVWVSPSFTSGGFFEADEPLVRIDPRSPSSSHAPTWRGPRVSWSARRTSSSDSATSPTRESPAPRSSTWR